MPSKKDKVLFVQLINNTTKDVVWEERYEIENGFVDGHIHIKDDLPFGNYSIVAYSEHSLFKRQDAFYAQKNITILKNISERKKTPIFNENDISEFILFPEGGHLVSELKNKLAFKALNKKGTPIYCSGTLFEENVPILKFNSIHAGLGKIDFTPIISKKYYIKLNQKPDTIYQLPLIKKSGKILSIISNTKSLLTLRVSKKSTVTETVYLRLQIKGVVYKMAVAKLKNNVIIKLPLEEIPGGIAEVTLFDNYLKPIAERLVYLKIDEKLQIKTDLKRSNYKTREKVTLRIKTTNQKGQPITAHLGLSVFDRFYQNKLNPKNILSHYYLSSQLKGNIYNPSYYFNKNNKNRKQALDLLLLTQGWRKYIWNDNHLKTRGKLLESEIFDEIKGKVLAKRKKHKELNMPMYIGAFNGSNESTNDIIYLDSLKNFVIRPKHLKIDNKDYLYLKLYSAKFSGYKIAIKDLAFKKINELKKYKKNYYPLYKKKLIREKEVKPFISTAKTIELDEVKVKTKIKSAFKNKFISKLDSLAKFDLNLDFICHINHLNCPLHLGRRNKRPLEGVSYSRVLVFRSGSWVEPKIAIKGEPTKIVPLPPYSYPKYTEEELLELFGLVRMKGYYEKREFYKPTYDELTINDPIPDYRNTLFWKPNIITDKNEEVEVTFYCSDINNVFIGNIEGVSQNGLLGNDSFSFNVFKRE